MTDLLYEVKLEYYSKAFEDKVRTFCMNPGGEVVKEHLDDVITVNGIPIKRSFYQIRISLYWSAPISQSLSKIQLLTENTSRSWLTY